MTPGEADQRGLIREAYRIEGITEDQCRSIFVDWAISVPGDMKAAVLVLLQVYGGEMPDHPMTGVLRAAVQDAPAPRRRGGRRGRMDS
ncbi:hypothetical protein [Actibacterium sp. XHP0104]|uniref:hypothetical protein n=1 Tax=Actibacterium sp. XHP0104 TaxID=2984335 RepID=UPI0021E7AECB|nr:hypothetical protein [Actibacterium sp. XHP0104]MCV2880902.1 hypothetical protein [Actibacterium sp. XHP0104]